MKKFLLSLGAVAVAFATNATVYTLYDTSVEEKGWTVNADNEFELQTSIRGAEFTIVAPKDPRASGYYPGMGNAPIRLRENLVLSINSSIDMKKVRFTYSGTAETYVAQGEVSEGWVQGEIVKSDDEESFTPYSMVITNEAGSQNFSFTSTEKYIQIAKIEVTDTDFSDNEEGPDAVLESIADLYDINPGSIVKVNFDMTIAYAYNKTTSIYATDNEGNFIKVVGPGEYQNYLILKGGWTGTFKIENNLFPVIYALSDFPAPDPNEKGEFTPTVKEAAEVINPMSWSDLVNNVFTIKDVELTATTPYDQEGLYNDTPFNGTSDNVELTFSNKFNLMSVGAGVYNITVVFGDVNVENDVMTPVLYVARFEKSSGTGINDLTVDSAENGEAEYYTLQGIKATNVDKGMYIRVENGKASKIVVK